MSWEHVGYCLGVWMPPGTDRYSECGRMLFYEGRGRRPKYCSAACRQRAYRLRRKARQAQGTMHVRTVTEKCTRDHINPDDVMIPREAIANALRESPDANADFLVNRVAGLIKLINRYQRQIERLKAR